MGFFQKLSRKLRQHLPTLLMTLPVLNNIRENSHNDNDSNDNDSSNDINGGRRRRSRRRR